MKLLVSVQGFEEARVALNAGVSILDIKAPLRGSLGAADSDEIEKCLVEWKKYHANCHPEVQFSCACGEVLDPHPEWKNWKFSGHELNYLKLGLAGLGEHSNWCSEWMHTRSEIEMRLGIRDSRKWVAVIYADHHLAQSPPSEDVIKAAAETGCCGVLFDTFSKQQGRLLEILSEPELESLCDQIHEAELFSAVAGRIRLEDLRRLCRLPIDLVAVRSAACDDEDRNGTVSKERLELLLEELNRCASPSAPAFRI